MPSTRAGKGAALVLPFCNTAAANLHLAAIGEMISPGKHAVVMLDQAGWHLCGDVVVLATITLLPLLPKGRKLIAMEHIRQFMRGLKATPPGRHIVAPRCHSRNRIIDQPWRVTSVGPAHGHVGSERELV